MFQSKICLKCLGVLDFDITINVPKRSLNTTHFISKEFDGNLDHHADFSMWETRSLLNKLTSDFDDVYAQGFLMLMVHFPTYSMYWVK